MTRIIAAPRRILTPWLILLLLLPVTGLAQVVVSLPDTAAQYAATVQLPVQINGLSDDVLAVELSIAYDAQLLTPLSPLTTGTLTQGWLMAHNVIAGPDNIDTLKIAMATAQQPITSAGALVLLRLQTADLRQPAVTPLRLTRIRLNAGQPAAAAQHGSLTLTRAEDRTPAPAETAETAETVALYQFAGNLHDDSPHGLHLQAYGNAQVIDGVLRTRELGDQVSVAIPDELLMPGDSASPLILEARILPRAYLVDKGSYPLVSLAQSWDARLELRDDKSSAYPRVWVGSRCVVPGETWGNTGPLGVWRQLRISLAADGSAAIYLDGQLIGASTFPLNYARTNDWILTLGNFDGEIDQVRLTRQAAIPAVKPALTSVENDPAGAGFELLPNYPNPFNPSTTLGYTLSAPARVQLLIYNALGQPIRTLIEAEQPAGFHQILWDGRDNRGNQVGAGIYLYRLEAGSHAATRKMFLIK